MVDSVSDCALNDVLDQQMVMLMTATTAAANSTAFFDDEEMAIEDQRFVDPDEGVRDQLYLLMKTPSLFKIMTNFTSPEFEELSATVCPILATTARSTGQPRGIFGRT